MSDKTLNQIGKEAATKYEDHGYAASGLRKFEKQLDDFQNGVDTHGFTEEGIKIVTGRVKDNYEDQVLDSRQFAANNAEQLHDLALIEAHLGGVAINVEQSIEIGHKVEVHTPNQQ